MVSPTTPTALGKYRVLELAGASGVYCGKLLADMGADVIKVEKPGGDDTRRIPPFVGGDPHPEKSLFFLYHNTNKRSITLNLETADGRELFRRLVEKADALIETTPVGYLGSLGLGYDRLREVNPGLVMTSVTGFGQTGPYKDFKSCDIVAWAMGGMHYMCGDPATPPVMGAGYQAYITTSMAAATATLIALYHKAATGEGQQVDISMQEAVNTLTPEMGTGRYFDELYPQPRYGTHRPGYFPGGCFPTKDGWEQIIAIMPNHWDALASWVHEATGNEAILEDIFKGPAVLRWPYFDILKAMVDELTQHLTMQEVFHEGQRRKIPITPVNTPGDVAKDPQLQARGYFVEIEHPVAGGLTYPGAPYQHQATPWSLRRPAPLVGQHNQEIYCGELGLSRERLIVLRAAGVI